LRPTDRLRLGDGILNNNDRRGLLSCLIRADERRNDHMRAWR
ncbi:MAG: hypothetical protein RI915_1663, partial [Pseudomonadota bacterium]